MSERVDGERQGRGVRWKDAGELLKETFESFRRDKAPRLAAALSYYAIFSIAPLLLLTISTAGLYFGEAAVAGRLEPQLRKLAGPQAAGAIQELLRHAHRPGAGVVATIVGLLTMLVGAAGIFGQLQDALNTVWKVTPAPGQGLLATLRARILPFGMVLGVGFLLLVSLILSAAISAVRDFMGDRFPLPDWVGPSLDLALSLLVFTLLLALIYKVLPQAQIVWRDVWAGAALTAALFVIGKFLIGLYLGRSGVSSAYGAAGSLVVLLIWIYYSAQIFLFGAEFTRVYACRYRPGIAPEPGAVPLTREQQAEQGIPPTPQTEPQREVPRRRSAA